MLTNNTITAFVRQPTRVIADALIGSQLLGTPAGDKILTVIRHDDSEAYGALRSLLAARGVEVSA